MKGSRFIILIWFTTIKTTLAHENYCSKAFGCSGDISLGKVARYILYDVNAGEGFNLKRDVYMRMAMFVRGLAEESDQDWHLVLPPWTRQWHWKNEKQSAHSWSSFFDVPSLQLYSPVIELDQYLVDYGDTVDEAFVLQHFPEFYEWAEGKEMDWSDRWSYAECRDRSYSKSSDGNLQFFQGKKHIKTKKVKCVSFQGSSEYLVSIVSSTKANSILFDRAEIATHMMYGDANYWMCRRSMRFALHLVEAANIFRSIHLDSHDEQDGTIRPIDWRDEKPHRSARGGPYLSVHLRRQDFIQGRPKDVPSLDQSAFQIKKHLADLNLTTVFIASDMPEGEYKYLKQLLEKSRYKTVKYEPEDEELSKFKEGGLAIIDQIIASHARFFVGTHESTFSFRIQEEREIMGFPPNTTFNRFCPTLSNKPEDCTPPSRWLIKYPDNDHRKSVYMKHDHSKLDEL